MNNDKYEAGFHDEIKINPGDGCFHNDSKNLLSAMEKITVKNKLKYQSVFEHINTGFAYFNVEQSRTEEPVDFIILECNSAFKRNSGITKKNIIGEKASNLFNLKEEWCKLLFHNLKKVAISKEPMHFEIYIKKYHKYISFSSYCPSEGNLELLSCDITEFKDITELKRISMYFSARFINTPTGKINHEIDNALYEIRHFYDAECSCIYQYDEAANSFVCTNKCIMKNKLGTDKCNEANLDRFAWLMGQIHDNQIVKAISPEELPEVAADERNYFISQGYKSFVYIPITYEEKILGIIGLITMTYEKVWTSEQIDLLKIISTIFASAIKRKVMDEKLQGEIDKLVKLKETLKDSEEKYRKLTFSIQDAVIMLDENGYVVNWNKAAEAMFGYSFKEIEGKNLHKLLVPQELMPRALENYHKFKETGMGRLVNKVTEVHAMRKDGSKFIAEISVSAVKLKGVNHAVGIVRDISERRLTQRRLLDAMEAAQAASKAKSQFLANISHEIRTPMNGIIGFLDLLSKTHLNRQQEDYLREIQTASDSLLSLINDLLDFSKIEANKLELEHIPFDIQKAIEEVTSSFSLRAYSKGIELHAHIDNEIPASVIGDSEKVKQILENLISNAVKFTHKGRVIVTAKLVSLTNEKVELLISVKDTGIGISEADRKRLFEPFTQVDASTTRKYGGTGLGLSICEKLVGMMSGNIAVASEEGQGSTFSFHIVLDRDPEAKEHSTVVRDLLCNTKILIADQSRTNREIIRYYLEGAGCLVSEAGDAVNAYEILKEQAAGGNRFDLALLNYDLLDLNGLELAVKIKTDEELKDISLHLMTYYVNPCDRSLALEKGFSQLIYKPVFRNELYHALLLSLGADILGPAQKQPGTKMIDFDEHQKESTRILLVEDNSTNQKLVASILKTADLAYDITENGYEALKALETHRYDVVFMDCQMPIMDGYEATRRIRNGEDNGKHIAIIAMTANVMQSDIDKCLSAGMDDYISKPFIANDFLGKIVKWLSVTKGQVQGGLSVITDGIPESAADDSIRNIGRTLDKLSEDQMISREDIYDIYNEFVDFLPQLLHSLSKAFEEQKQEEIASCAHKLKGASATLRLNTLSKMAAELERQGKAGNMDLCREFMERILRYSDKIEKVSL